MAKQKKITMEEYRKNPQAEKKNVKGYRPYTGKKERKTKSKEDAELITLAKRANVRLKALEDNKMRVGAYKAVHRKQLENVSYMREVDGKPRFRQGVKGLNENQKKSMREFLEKFLDYRTSTLSGIKKSRNQAKETFEENLGHTLTQEEYGAIIEHMNQSTIKHRYSSDAFVDVVALGLDNNFDLGEVLETINLYDTGVIRDIETLMDLLTKDNEENEEDFDGWSTSNEWDNIF